MIHKFKEFSGIIEESLLDSGQSYINKAFLAGPPILMSDGKLVERSEILKSIHNALKWISDQFITFYEFVEDFTIIYVLDNPKCPTMYVDNKMQLVINARFVYENLKNDQKYIRAVLMHEMLHVFLDHIDRGINYNTAHGLDSYNKSVQHDNNLAADAEVNKMLTSLGLLKKEELVNEIKGVFLNNGTVVDGVAVESDILSMESILDNKKLIDYLRSKFPCGEVDQGPTGGNNDDKNTVIHTTEEWDQGRIDAWNKCAELIKKYGKKGFIEELQKEGILDGLGSVIDLNKDKIMSMQFINIKSYTDFINESSIGSSQFGGEGEYTTYEDGFNKTVMDILSKVMKSLEPRRSNDDDNNGPVPPPPPGPKIDIESGVKQEDLLPIDIDIDDDDDGDGGKSPDNNYRNKSKKNKKNNNKDKKDSTVNPGNNDDDFDPDDFDPNNSAIMNDAKKKNSSDKSKSGQRKGKLVDKISVGHTGGMLLSDNEIMDDILKDSGYTEEQVEKIKKITEKNSIINTKEVVNKKRADVANKLKSGDPIRIEFERALEAANEYKDLWNKVLKKFMNKNTDYAGVDIPGENIKWGEKRRLSIGQISPEVLKTSKEPQFINMYPDVSGSMNIKLLRELSEALYTYMVQFKYSGVNLAPWASNSGNFANIESIHKRSKSAVVDDIVGRIEHARDTLGGGTDLAGACVPQIVTANSENKKNVHITLTDGEVGEGDLNGLESYIIQETDNPKINKRCIWLIYSNDQGIRKMWEKNIKQGTLVFINPDLYE